MKVKRTVTRKRLYIMITFSFFLVLSSILASNNQNGGSFFILFLSNLYLYIKLSLHITLHGLNKTIFQRRLNIIVLNMFIIALLGIINYKKNTMINNNVIY
jgi:hypothetical protein